MHIVFFSTSDVFKAEEILMNRGIKCKIVPTPVLDKEYCSVCVEVKCIEVKKILEDMEYKAVN